MINGIHVIIGSPSQAVLLDRVSGGQPEYCVHGRTMCVGCNEWCWLGNETLKLVQRGKAAPVCLQCAARDIVPGTRPIARVNDHRRADGPHD